MKYRNFGGYRDLGTSKPAAVPFVDEMAGYYGIKFLYMLCDFFFSSLCG